MMNSLIYFHVVTSIARIMLHADDTNHVNISIPTRLYFTLTLLYFSHLFNVLKASVTCNQHMVYGVASTSGRDFDLDMGTSPTLASAFVVTYIIGHMIVTAVSQCAWHNPRYIYVRGYAFRLKAQVYTSFVLQYYRPCMVFYCISLNNFLCVVTISGIEVIHLHNDVNHINSCLGVSHTCMNLSLTNSLFCLYVIITSSCIILKRLIYVSGSHMISLFLCFHLY